MTVVQTKVNQTRVALKILVLGWVPKDMLLLALKGREAMINNWSKQTVMLKQEKFLIISVNKD